MRKILLLTPLLLLLSGCFGSENLMQAPRPAVQYRNLQTQIDVLIADGYTYSAPVSGDNRQAVLTADLTGDGTEAAVVLMRNETENILAVFLSVDDEFIPVPPIYENVESVHSIVFCDMNGDGRQEIIVGWQVGSQRYISVYTLDENILTEIFTSPYSGYAIYDIEDNGIPALLLVKVDTSEQLVEMVTDRGGELAVASTAYLSPGAEAVRRIRTGPLLDKKPGLLITSQYQTGSGEITDVIAFRDGGLVNISASIETGVSEMLVRNRELAAADIDDSGVYSLPRLVELPPYQGGEESSEDIFTETRWMAYDSVGYYKETARTYHSMNNTWYILLPEQWPQPEQYTVRRTLSSAPQKTTFSLLQEEGEPIDFLHIYYLNQPVNDRRSVRDRTVLAEYGNLFATAEIIPLPDEYAHYALSEAELKSIFKIIPADWRGL
ncbi:MAG: hypothetical protein FWG31_00985 [Oscillospiraceae bacterium]|nr:hypothetical protein [Oscillospiraceae bacterium]